MVCSNRQTHTPKMLIKTLEHVASITPQTQKSQQDAGRNPANSSYSAFALMLATCETPFL